MGPLSRCLIPVAALVTVALQRPGVAAQPSMDQVFANIAAASGSLQSSAATLALNALLAGSGHPVPTLQATVSPLQPDPTNACAVPPLGVIAYMNDMFLSFGVRGGPSWHLLLFPCGSMGGWG